MNDTVSLFSAPLIQLGATTLSLGQLVVAVAGALLLLLALLAASSLRNARARAEAEALAAVRAREAEMQLSELAKAQAELQGRMGTIAEVFGARQAELTKTISERLDGMSSRLGQSITDQTKATHENLARLQERLAVIDTAQNNIQSLAGQVVQLQQILSNKQTRGAFGQSRMEAIIADGLPPSAYEF